MQLHANAALSLNQRRRLALRVLEEGWSLTKAAEAAEVSDHTAAKWVARYRAEGEGGLLDRSSAPAVIANRTDERRVAAIAALRRLRFTAPQLAELLDMPLSTVSGILTRIGMGKLGRLGLEPAVRYERARPGELIHIDVKKLGRIQGGAGKRITGVQRNPRPRRRDAAGVDRKVVGWDYVHIAIDDATRLAYAEVLADEKAATAVGFLRRAPASPRLIRPLVSRPFFSSQSSRACSVVGRAAWFSITHPRTLRCGPRSPSVVTRRIRAEPQHKTCDPTTLDSLAVLEQSGGA